MSIAFSCPQPLFTLAPGSRRARMMMVLFTAIFAATLPNYAKVMGLFGSLTGAGLCLIAHAITTPALIPMNTALDRRACPSHRPSVHSVSNLIMIVDVGFNPFYPTVPLTVPVCILRRQPFLLSNAVLPYARTRSLDGVTVSHPSNHWPM